MAEDIDVRRLRLEPGDSLVMIAPAGVNPMEAKVQLQAALQAIGLADVPTIVIAGDASLYVLPGGMSLETIR